MQCMQRLAQCLKGKLAVFHAKVFPYCLYNMATAWGCFGDIGAPNGGCAEKVMGLIRLLPVPWLGADAVRGLCQAHMLIYHMTG